MRKAVVWSFAEQVAQQVVSLFAFLFIARVIGPSSYGLFGAAYAPVAILISVVSVGLTDRLFTVAHSDRNASTIFWAVNAAGAAMTAALLILAAPLSSLLNLQDTVPLIRALAPMVLLTTLTVVPAAFIERTLNYRALAFRTAVCGAASSVVAAFVAVRGGGAWSPVTQLLLQQSLSMAVVWQQAKWRPSRTFDAEFLRASSVQLLTAARINLLNGSEFFLARMMTAAILGAHAAGLLTAAQRICQLSLHLFSYPFAKIGFVLTSREKDDQAAATLFGNNLWSAFALLSPLVFGYAAIGSAAMPMVLGPAWAELHMPLSLLLFQLFPAASMVMLSSFLRAKQKQSVLVIPQFIYVVLLGLAYWSFMRVGLISALAAGLIAMTACAIASLWLAEKASRLRLVGAASGATQPIIAGLVMAGVVIKLSGTESSRSLAILGLEVGAGAAVYSAVLGLLSRKRLVAAMRAVRDLRSQAR